MSACTVNPVTGEKQLSLMSYSQQIAMGNKNYGPYQQMQGGRYIVDPDLNVYINQVGQKVAAHSEVQLPYEFVVLNNDTPNAWALPGGKIAINRGLLVMLEDEAQLSAVLGHEVVHAAAQHSANQMAKAQLAQVGVLAAGIASKDSEYAALITAGAMAGSQALLAKYGRDQELEADYHGMRYMAEAGYALDGAVELQQTFVELSKGQKSDLFSQLFASHPPSQDRVDRNRQRALKLSVTGQPKRNKRAYQNAIKQLIKDKSAYALHSQALLALNKKQFDQALSLTKKAINKQNKEAQFQITAGKIYLAKKKDKAAKNHFQAATKHNPEYFEGFLGLGLAAYSQEDWPLAKTSLERSKALLPTQTASYYLGEIALRAGQKSQAVSHYREATQGGGEWAQRANLRLQSLVN